MSGRSRRTRKTAVPKASSPPDAIKPALRQTLAELSAKLDVLSMTEDTDLEDQLEKSISEGEAKLRSALAAWAVTRRQSSETERQMRENAAVRGLISAIEHEQKAEEQECWKDHGEMGPLQTALKIFVEACGLSDANTDVEAPPWKPQVYTRLAENDGESYEPYDDTYQSNFRIQDRAEEIMAEAKERNKEGGAEEEGDAEEEDL